MNVSLSVLLNEFEDTENCKRIERQIINNKDETRV